MLCEGEEVFNGAGSVIVGRAYWEDDAARVA